MSGALDELQLQSALGEQRRWGRPLGVTLVEMGLIEESVLVKILSTQLNIAAIDLDRVEIEPAALQLLDYELCNQYQCLPFRYEERGKFLHLAMADPTNIDFFDDLRVRTQCNLRPHLAGPKSIELLIRRHYLGETAAPAGRDASHLMHRGDEMMLDGAEPSRGAPRAGQNPYHTGTLVQPPSSGHHPAVGAGNPAASAAPSAAQRDVLSDVLRELKEVKAMLHRDEMVLRKLMSLFVQKGVCTREELVARLHED